MDCVIIGAGVAGMQAAFSCRQHWPQKTVTLIDAEAEVGYFRTLLPQFMVRTLAQSKLFFWKPENDPKLVVRSGLRVASLDRSNQRVILENGEKTAYERLILAPGGRPIVPGICARSSCDGIFPIRNLASARVVQKWLPDHSHIVILGGGLVGVKTAAHMARPELSVTLVEKEDQLLPQALSPRAAALVKAHLERKNIRIITGHSVEDIQVQGGELKAVQVGAKGIPCGTLLVAAGSVPDVQFLKDSDLLVKGELAVTPALQTSDPHIFAAGDAVTIQRDGNFTPWTWPQAITQGKLAGRNCYAKDPVQLNAFSRVNSMNLDGLSLVVLGAPVMGAEAVVYSRPGEGICRELFLKNGRIVGGALVGDISGAGVLHAAMNAGVEMDITDEDLLKPMSRALRQISIRCSRPKRRALFK
ncbi:MAG: FAD-dependent oxidoreductase [Desulfobacterales bacterium]|nr:FAD-dependent oxidoreductase [Desulfobacterales bacterium]